MEAPVLPVRVPKVPLIILIKVDDQPEFDRELNAMVRIKFDTSDEEIITITKRRALLMGIGLRHEDKILAIGINRIRKRDNTPERIEAIYYIEPYLDPTVVINTRNNENVNNPVNPGPVNQNGGKKPKTRRHRPTRKLRRQQNLGHT